MGLISGGNRLLVRKAQCRVDKADRVSTGLKWATLRDARGVGLCSAVAAFRRRLELLPVGSVSRHQKLIAMIGLDAVVEEAAAW